MSKTKHEDRRHKLKIGMTRGGKSYETKQEIKTSGVATIYYNLKHEKETIDNSKVMSGKNTAREMLYALEKYRIINFYASHEKENRDKELKKIIDLAFYYNKEIDLVFDEAPQYLQQGTYDSPIYRATGMGLYNIRVILLAQSPAEIDKRAIKNCEEIKIFRMNEWDWKYLRGIGLDSKEIKEKILNAPQYSYIELLNGEIKEPKRA